MPSPAPRCPAPAGRPGRPASRRALWAGLALGLASALPAGAQGWEPTAPVELVVPAGTGGGADQMARFIAQLATGKQLLKQPINVVNKPGNSGLDGLLDVKASRGNPHRLVITLSSLFTAPLATGADFHWKDLTPVQLLALDQFVLWVNAASPHKTAKDLLDALRAAPPGSFRLGGTGSRQEDQLVAVLLETAAATRITYVPLKGGGDVAKALADGQVELTVNNPIEAEALWRQGKLRPLCVFDGQKIESAARGWSELPTCMSAGIPAQYQMMRGIFTSPGVSEAQLAFWNQLLTRVRALPEWKDFMARGAFKSTAMSGPEFTDWLDRTNRFHNVLMREAGLKAGSAPSAPAATPPAPAVAPARKP